MIVMYRCKCGHEFNGHWNQAYKRRIQFPEIKPKEAMTPADEIRIAMICPKCGNEDPKKNIDSDEDFKSKQEDNTND